MFELVVVSLMFALVVAAGSYGMAYIIASVYDVCLEVRGIKEENMACNGDCANCKYFAECIEMQSID